MSEMTTRDFTTAHSGGHAEWPTDDLLKLINAVKIMTEEKQKAINEWRGENRNFEPMDEEVKE